MVAGQTSSELEDALDEGPWHVFHFIGHGGYDRAANEGTLALADETGRTHPLPTLKATATSPNPLRKSPPRQHHHPPSLGCSVSR